MRKIANALFAALLLVFAAGCQKEYQMSTPLAVTAQTLNLGPEAGSTHIIVYSNTDWTVSLDRQAEWASLSKLSGSGMHELEFSYSANYGVSRSVGIVIKTAEKSVTVNMVQGGEISNPSIVLDRTAMIAARSARTLRCGMTTNLNFCLDDIKAKAVYYAQDGSIAGTYEVGSGQGWIRSYSVSDVEVLFEVEDNNEGVDRHADLVFYITDGSNTETRSTIRMIQSCMDPTFELESESGDYYANAKSYKIAARHNNVWSSDELSLTATEDWVKDMAIDSTGLSFSIDRNQDGAYRSATINVDLSDGSADVHAAYQVSQAPNMKLSFEELRALPSGKLVNDDILEGFIVSDFTSPNLCSSPQVGQYEFDRSENYRTAYLESEDGMYGVMLKFESADQNIMPQWTKVQVNLNGCTLASHRSPARFVLSGLKASSLTALAEPDESAVPAKRRTVAQLTENDIYTLVTLYGMEVMQKDGSFTNCSDAFSLKDETNPYSGTDKPWWDVAPLLCHDRSGAGIHILTNAAAPWRRDGVDLGGIKDPVVPVVPQGSGDIRGIIVYDEVAPVRYGNLGQLQIRPMSLSDITMEDASYTTTVVEWNWNDFSPAITPTIGSGTLDVSGLVDSDGKSVAATRTLSNDYNNTYNGREGDGGNGNAGINMAGLVKNGAMKLTKPWWNFNQGKGEYFDIKFNMAGTSGSNLFVGLVWGHGEGNPAAYYSPSQWRALYSVDGGATWNDVPGVDIIHSRSCICPDNYSVDACPGFTEHIINLPTNCFGKSDVRLRLQVAGTICDAPAPAAGYKDALCIEQGVLTPSATGADCQVILGTITVRYN